MFRRHLRSKTGLTRSNPFCPRLVQLEDRTTPATFVVTNAVDGGTGSLRDAINLANANPDADTIVFAPALAGATINLTTVGDTSIGPSGLIVSAPVTIAGTGQTITRPAASPEFRLFAVALGGGLTLQNLTLSNGIARGGAGVAAAGGAAGLGGAVYNIGSLSITGCTLTGNQAIGGSAIAGGSSSYH